MSLLTRLERALGRYALTDLALYLVMGQVIVLALAMFGGFDVERIMLQPGSVLAGQIWRPFSFIFVPPVTSLTMTGAIFLAFGWYIFYLMSSALEHHWGVFRFNAFIFLGWLLTVAVSFVTPFHYATNGYIAATVFLAFAYLNPDFVMYIFFILPVKIKWLALLQWLVYAYLVAVGDLAQRLAVLASVGNFLCFFSHDIVRSIKTGRRRMAWQAEQFAQERHDRDPRHRCHVCGKTDLTDPRMDFRYCSKCAGDECYCAEHIGSHAHVVRETPKA